MSKHILITDKDGQEYQIPDSWLANKIRGEYGNLPPLQAWSKAIGDWIKINRLPTPQKAINQ